MNTRFESVRWDVAFSYIAHEEENEIRVKEVADKIYLYRTFVDPKKDSYTDFRLGQYLAIFEKNPHDNLHDAITKRILIYPGQDALCHVVAQKSLELSITRATIEYTKDLSQQAIADKDREGVCSAYRGDRATHYFWMDEKHPDRFFFYSFDESLIYALGPRGERVPWYATLEIKPHVPLPYPPPTYGNRVHVEDVSPTIDIMPYIPLTFRGAFFTEKGNEIYPLPVHSHSNGWWRTWYCILRNNERTYNSQNNTMQILLPSYVWKGGCTDYRGAHPGISEPEHQFTFFVHNSIGLHAPKIVISLKK
jgi:hypothetical protein